MIKLYPLICLSLVALNLVACSDAPAKPGTTVYMNTQDQQRANSREAQGELSSEVKR